MQVEIKGNKKLEFTPEGISYILDILTNCPWKNANPLINDIMAQLKSQEGDTGGTSRYSADTPSRGHAGDGSSRLATVEALQPSD